MRLRIKTKRTLVAATLGLTLCLILAACSTNVSAPRLARPAATLTFGAERRLGQTDKNPSTPFLRYSPDGRLYAIWTQDDHSAAAQAKQPAPQHHQSGEMGPSPMREALLAWSAAGGKTWSPPKRINSAVEAVQGEENGPKVAFSADNKAYVVWSIPGEKGNRMRANVRFALEDGKGGFTPARTLNEVRDAARFPIIEVVPDGTLLVAWIDRRVDNPIPRQLYLMRLSPTGQALTNNYKVGEELCECCRLGITFADSGKTVYMVDRQVSSEQIRNHVLRKSTDGGATFGPPVEISDDGWKVPFCPHSGPTIGRDSRGYLHITWWTLGRSPKEAGVYYTVSKDGNQSFAPRQLVQANTGTELLHTMLAVGHDGTVHLAWDNLDASSKSQVFVRNLAPDDRSWSPIQQISQATGNAIRPALAVSDSELHVAWTQTDGEASWVVLKSAPLRK